MEAEIITIGTELLLGELVDTNTRTIARQLREIGLNMYRTATVGDNAERIAQAVSESISRAQVVITTGGLGPTVDDATRDGIALAFGASLTFQPELWEQIQERFARFGLKPTENNRRQAHLPQDALSIENPIGTAPAFLVETETGVVIALPGVPAEMVYLLENEVIPYLTKRFELQATIKTRIIRTAGVGESWLDSQIQDLEQMSNPTVGLAAHPGRVDIRLTAKASTPKEAEGLIAHVEGTILERLGDAVYGFDDDTLEAVAVGAIQSRGWRIVSVESGTEGALEERLKPYSEVFIFGHVSEIEGEIERTLEKSQTDYAAEVGVGVQLLRDGERHMISVVLRTPEGVEKIERFYGGPEEYASDWSTSMALNLIRKRLA
jgi:competence/damage-inducible protein CinA-like protein